MPPMPFKKNPKMPPLPFKGKDVNDKKDEAKIEENTKPKMPPLPFAKKEVAEKLVEKSDVPEGYEGNDEWMKPLDEEYVSRWS